MSEENKIIQGSGGGGGKGGGGDARIPVESPDSLQSLQIARVLDLISEGEIEGLANGLQSIFYDDTPLQNEDGTLNFSNVTVQLRKGTQNQNLTSLEGVENEIQVNTQLTAVNPIEKTITDPNVSEAYITIGIPQLTRQNLENGDITGTSVAIKLEVSSGGGAFEPVIISFVPNTNRGTFLGNKITIRTAATYNTGKGGVIGKAGGGGSTKTYSNTIPSKATGYGTQTITAIEGYPEFAESVASNRAIVTYGIKTVLGYTEQNARIRFALQSKEIGVGADWVTEEVGERIVTGPRQSNRFFAFERKLALSGTGEFRHDLGRYKYRVLILSAVTNKNRNILGSTVAAVTKVISYVGTSALTISGKTITRYQRGFSVDLEELGEAPWILRLSRLTADSTKSSLRNETYWDSYTEVNNVKLNYPNSAVVFTGIDAKQFSTIPRRGFEILGIRVKIPSNYDPFLRTYEGIWDGTFTVAWTNNPAWIFYDIITNDRYGLGDLIPEELVDKWTLYEVSQYCDEEVIDGYDNPEPRFTCNLYLQAREDAYRVIANMASIFRSMAYWSGGAITVSQDAPKEVSYIFNSSNVIGGTFEYASTSLKSRHNSVLVSWNNPDDRYKLAVEYVEDVDDIAERGLIQTEVVAMGCTSRTQAYRLGKWLLYTELEETETVNFTTGLDGLLVGLGSIINVQDPFRAGTRLGGRIDFATVDKVVIDSPITIEADKTYELSVILPYPKQNPSETIFSSFTGTGEMVSVTLNNAPGETTELTFDTPLDIAPQNNSMWVVATSELSLQTFRVISIVEKDKTQAEIIGIKYNAAKYDAVEQDILLDEIFVSGVDAVPPIIEDLEIQEYPSYVSPNVLSNRVDLSWSEQANVVKYKLYYIDKTRNTNPEFIDLETNFASLFPLEPGLYEGYIVGYSPLGKQGVQTPFSYEVLGKIAPPSNVENFRKTFTTNDIILEWDAIPDADLLEYEIRQGDSWEEGALVEKGLTSNLTRFSAPTLGTYKFFIAAKDTSLNYSSEPSELEIEIEGPAQVISTSNIVGPNHKISWEIPFSIFQIDFYNIRKGSEFNSSTIIATTKATTFEEKIEFEGTASYFIEAVDIAGNISPPSTTSISVSKPNKVTINPQVIDNNVLLYWSDAQSVLPIDTYELRRGETFATAEVIGTKSGNFTSFAETQSGNYKYWVVGIDSAGNYGEESSANTSVSQPKDYQILGDFVSDFSGTTSNAKIAEGSIFLPVNTTETFSEHFENNIWTSPEEQVNAGFPLFIQPTLGTGFYEEEFDLLGSVSAGRINLFVTQEPINDNSSLQTIISVKNNPGDSWIDFTDVNTVYTTQFRYIKVRLNATNTDSLSLIKISSISLKVDIKSISDAGEIVCNAADVGGTIVNFNIAFADVESITVSPKGTSPITPVYDFSDVANPTFFKILLFNSAGTRISGTASWSAKGY